jgi:hypothetical protein
MSAANEINTDVIKEELISWDLDRGGENASVSSQSSSELSQDLRDLDLFSLGEMEYQSTYRDRSLDYGSPILATTIPYPDSPPRGSNDVLGDLGFEELLTQSDFPIDDETLLKGLEGFLLRQNSVNPPPHAAHSSQNADSQLEAPPIIALAASKGKQIMERKLDAFSAPTEDRPQEAHDQQSVRNLLSVIQLQERHIESVHASHDAVAKAATTPEQSSKIANGTPKPQSYRPSKAENVPIATPTATGKFDGSAELGRTSDDGPSEPPMELPPVSSDIFFYYPSFEQAEQALRAHLDYEAPSDDTAPRTNGEKAILVTELFLAMTDMSMVPTVGEGSKKPQAIKSFEEGKYLDWQIQIVCWRVLV